MKIRRMGLKYLHNKILFEIAQVNSGNGSLLCKNSQNDYELGTDLGESSSRVVFRQ